MVERDTKRRRVGTSDALAHDLKREIAAESNIDDTLQTAGTSQEHVDDNNIAVVVPGAETPGAESSGANIGANASSNDNSNSAASSNAFAGSDADLLKLARDTPGGDGAAVNSSSSTGASVSTAATSTGTGAGAGAGTNADPSVGQDSGSGGSRDDNWHQVRRDNHKEVERRRRQTINNGIDQLARIVPDCDKHKGQILEKAVKYIESLLEDAKKRREEAAYNDMVLRQRIAELDATNKTLNTEVATTWSELNHWKKRCQQLEEQS